MGRSGPLTRSVVLRSQGNSPTQWKVWGIKKCGELKWLPAHLSTLHPASCSFSLDYSRRLDVARAMSFILAVPAVFLSFSTSREFPSFFSNLKLASFHFIPFIAGFLLLAWIRWSCRPILLNRLRRNMFCDFTVPNYTTTLSTSALSLLSKCVVSKTSLIVLYQKNEITYPQKLSHF